MGRFEPLFGVLDVIAMQHHCNLDVTLDVASV
jgi:hypothetical protein